MSPSSVMCSCKYISPDVDLKCYESYWGYTKEEMMSRYFIEK